MGAKEMRQAYHDAYGEILGRNYYSQSLRDYVYEPYKNGRYYSDCSSSVCAALNEAGAATGLLNTAGMHESSKFQKVDVRIVEGHVAAEDFYRLRVGDALMFAGNDASRPLQIGHVESIYVLGTDEGTTVLAGHGSGRPSTKDMAAYLSSRYASIAANGVHKGLVEVLRRIPDDGEEGGSTSKEYRIGNSREGLSVTADLNIRKTPKHGDITGTYRRGETVFPTAKCFVNGDAWFLTDRGWISGKYVTGWLQELDDGQERWWYVEEGYQWPASQWLEYQGKGYFLDKDGWMAVDGYVEADSRGYWYYVGPDGAWDPMYDTEEEPAAEKIRA